MRVTLLASLTLFALAGCRTGYLADHLIAEPQIIAPQLARYGFTQEQTRCLSERLAQRLGHADMRAFELRARAFRRGVTTPGAVAPRDLIFVADGAPQRTIPGELRTALTGCQIDLNPVAIAAAQPGAPAATASVAVPPGPSLEPEGSRPTWLNLGSAPSGQSISIDATSLRQEGTARIAWFRMTDPETGQPTLNSYRLRIDCSNRMYAPLGWRRFDEAGAIVDTRDYTAEVAPPQEVEAGTVTEIAFLSLCT
jgi:hypothetical protein